MTGRRLRRLARALPLALAAGLALAGCDELLVSDPHATSSVQIFDQVWSDFDRYYAHFELSGVDWPAARAHYRPLAAAASNDYALAAAIAGMLAELRDPHVTLFTPVFTYQDTSTYRPGCYVPAVTKRYVATTATRVATSSTAGSTRALATSASPASSAAAGAARSTRRWPR